jgi:UDP-N-acetylmuramate--alanine ligase
MARDVMVVDDYAHHPTEVRATLLAAKSWGRRIVAVFQPHLFSRTQLMAEGFADSLNLADVVYLADIYPAREEPIPGVTSALIVDRINVGGVTKAHLAKKDILSDELMKILEPGDILIVMGAGDIRSVAETVLARLESQQQ